MGEQVNVYDAKTRLSQLIDRAAKGEDIVIARAGRPIARLVAWQPRAVARKPGRLRGRIHVHRDFDALLPAGLFDGEEP